MPALATVVSTYINAIKTALTTGPDLSSNLRGGAQNYLAASDMANVLDLLQRAITTGSLTTVSGTTTSVTDGAGTFVPGQQVGNLVTFAGNTTAALAGVTAIVKSNTDRTLTFDRTLSDAPAAGDTFTITGYLVNSAINDLREGKTAPAAGSLVPASSPIDRYGDDRIARDALVKFIQQMTTVNATGTLTLTGNTLDGLTVTIGSKTYTFQDTLTNVDGNVDVGASASASLDNLIAAINLGAGSGSAYAAATTLHPTVSAAAGAGDTMVVTAKTLPGAQGNSIATTDTLDTEGSWAAETLTGGTSTSVDRSMGSMLTEAGSSATVINVDGRGLPLRIDALKNMHATILNEKRRIVSNNETSITLDVALGAGAPAAAVTVALSTPDSSADPMTTDLIRTFPGQQPGDNAVLGYLIGVLQAAVVAYTLPT